MSERTPPAVIVALGAVWIIWGSTYLGIRYGLETLPLVILSVVLITRAAPLSDEVEHG